MVLKSISIKRRNSNSGSTLILLVIGIAIIIVLGTSLMGVSMINYRIKKSNTEIKQSFYMAETGINTSFVSAYDLLVEAINDSSEKAENYLLIYPLNEIEAESIFSDNFKIFLINKIASRINENTNPQIEITNTQSLVFIGNKLTISIKSKYISKDNVESTTMADLVIVVPDYHYIDSTDYSKLISLNNWKIRR